MMPSGGACLMPSRLLTITMRPLPLRTWSSSAFTNAKWPR